MTQTNPPTRPDFALRLVPGTIAIFDADKSGDHTALASLLGVDPIDEWPPIGGEHDADAVSFFRSTIVADPNAADWLAHYVCVDNELVASAGFLGPPIEGTTEIGYSVCKKYRQRGIANATVRALIIKATNAGAIKLNARVRPDNTASLHVLERNGFSSASPVGDDGHLLLARNL
jgi:GNAT superfamily N-acetyltransferase